MIKGKSLYKSEQIHVAAKKLLEIKMYLETHNLGNRGVEDGDKQKQLIGLIGEIVVIERLTGQPIKLEYRKEGFDGGFDLEYKGKRIDVKTMERASYVKGDYVNNFYVMQEGYDSEIIIFCSYHTDDSVLEICGWIYKKDLPQLGKFYKKGTKRTRANGTSFEFRQDNYEVENKDLRPIKELFIGASRSLSV